MPWLRLHLAALLGVAALLPAPAGAGAASLRPALHRVVAAGAPGAMALVDGRATATGLADLRTRRRLRAGDRVRIGSLTKSFTAVVALQLVGEGRLELDDTVGERLPGILPIADRVTLRELLNHTSGIPDDVMPPILGVLHGNPARVWTHADVLGIVRDEPLRFPPGTGWAYSSMNYVLVGLMIEQATGRSLEHELEQRIVHPLGLRHTSFPVRDTRLGRGAAHGYSLDVGRDGPVAGALRDVTRYSPSFAWAAGNGVSTLRDVARFYRALLRRKLLTPRLLHEALTTVPTSNPRRRNGLGLAVEKTPTGTFVGHDGDILGFSIEALSTPDGRHQAIVATNAKLAPPAVDHALDEAMDAALETAGG
ncbi:MAG: serine hydrolase domain-containing protein [Solirubrobacterales bacterium]